MKKIFVCIFVLLFCTILLSSCTQQQSNPTDPSLEQVTGVLCTQEVQECPDGSFVGRDPENNCMFKECL